MAKLLIIASYGAEDPTRASMPFHLAKGAKEAGYEVEIILAGEAPVVLKDAIRENLQGVGMPAFKDLFQFALDSRIRLYV